MSKTDTSGHLVEIDFGAVRPFVQARPISCEPTYTIADTVPGILLKIVVLELKIARHCVTEIPKNKNSVLKNRNLSCPIGPANKVYTSVNSVSCVNEVSTRYVIQFTRPVVVKQFTSAQQMKLFTSRACETIHKCHAM